jgi:hypothetical protein
VIQATSNLEEQLRGRPIRGEVWELTRTWRKDKRGPVTGAYLLTLPEEELTPGRDVKPVLQRVFATEDVSLDQKNPNPPRVFDSEVRIENPALRKLVRPTSPPPPAAPTAPAPLTAAHQPNEPEDAYRERERRSFRERMEAAKKSAKTPAQNGEVHE